MKIRLGIVFAVGAVVLLVLFLYARFGIRRESASLASSGSTPTSGSNGDPGTMFEQVRWGGSDPDAFGQWLSASIPIERSDLASAERAKFVDDVQAWLAAYGDPRVDRVRVLFGEAGIEPPVTWKNDKSAQESWTESMWQLRDLTLDLSRTRVRRVQLGAEPAFGSEQETSRSCGARDGARAFLGSIDKSSVPAYEVIYTGSSRDPKGTTTATVHVGWTFAREPARGGWVLVRVCLYDFPEWISGYGPLL